MIEGKKIIVVLPAYNAERTLQRTYQELPLKWIDEVVLVDDCSADGTARLAAELGIKHVIRQPRNLGYGANQKVCYQQALRLGADVVVMVHPDYQYDPRLVMAMGSMIASGVFDCVLGSRILGTGALAGGMPVYKYVFNRLLTAYQNILIPHKLSEYHTGLRAFSREILETLPLDSNSNDFLFDNQMLVQILAFGFKVGEVTCPTRYLEDSSSINLRRSIKYGIGVLATTLEFRLARIGLMKSRRFPKTKTH